MNQDKFIELITKELTVNITDEERIELHQLVENNPQFANQRKNFLLYWANENLDKTDDKRLFEQITSKIDEQQPERGRNSSIHNFMKNFGMIWKAAAVLLVAISLWLFSRPVQQIKPANLQVVITQAGHHKMFTLPDGTKITMNAGSKISYPTTFSGPTREVSLTGEAFFDVHKDHEHPFIIHTRKINIRVVGTAFNVKAYANDKFSETTLIRGIIQVTLNDRPNDRITLKPTEKLIVNYTHPIVAEGKTEAKKNEPAGLPEVTFLHKKDTTIVETSWLQNKLMFNDEDFQSLANSLERRYNVHVSFENTDVAKLRFSGLFVNEKVTEVLNTLKLIENFNYRIEKKNKIVIY